MNSNVDTKKSWAKPTLSDLDVSETLSGTVINVAEGAFVGETTGGEDLFGAGTS